MWIALIGQESSVAGLDVGVLAGALGVVAGGGGLGEVAVEVLAGPLAGGGQLRICDSASGSDGHSGLSTGPGTDTGTGLQRGAAREEDRQHVDGVGEVEAVIAVDVTVSRRAGPGDRIFARDTSRQEGEKRDEDDLLHGKPFQ